MPKLLDVALLSDATPYTAAAAFEPRGLLIESVKYDLAMGQPIEIGGTKSHDVLVGNAADNSIWGHGGGDTMSGGHGKDTFAYWSMYDTPRVWDGENNQHDVILDFQPGKDKIDLSRIDANVHMGRDQAFKLVEGDGPPNDGEIRQHYNPETNVTRVSFFDGQTDSQIDVVGKHQFTADDFVL